MYNLPVGRTLSKPYAPLSSMFRTCMMDGMYGSVASYLAFLELQVTRQPMTNNLSSIRHVKCDEKRPACERCTKTGRKCDGYQKSPWEVNDVSSMASLVSLSNDPRTASDPHAGRGFAVFEKLTTGTLAGLFETSLWQEVLRASQHNDTIWHAATALGSAHESYLHRKFDMQTLEEDRAMKHYNKAIRLLTKTNALGKNPSPDIIMASSILFMAFEVSLSSNTGQSVIG